MGKIPTTSVLRLTFLFNRSNGVVDQTLRQWPLVTLGQHGAHEVDPAPLPGHAGHGGIDGVHQGAVVVGDHQLGPAQPAVAQGPEELGPEVVGFTVPDRAAQDLTAPVSGHAGGDDDGLGGDPGALAVLVATDPGPGSTSRPGTRTGRPARPGRGC